MEVERVLAMLRTRLIGRTVVHFTRTGSTNDVARDLAERGAPGGTVVLADYQSAGHGRRGRTWLADPGDSLLVSTVLRPSVAPAEVFYLTMVPALAVVGAIEDIGVDGTGLKWPNDVQIRGRKTAGILTELSLQGHALDYVVVGIGLNVRMDVSRHDEIAALATSVQGELGKAVDSDCLAARLLERLEEQYLALEAGRGPSIFEAWRARLTTIGQWVNVTDGGGSYRALAEDVTIDGGLVLRRDGQRVVVYGGDVTLAGEGR